MARPFRAAASSETMTRPRVARLQRYSNMGILTRLTFQATRPEGKSDKAEDQDLFRNGYEIATAYAEDPSGWLVLTGPSGCGKTHLAAAIANKTLEAGRPAFLRLCTRPA